MIDYIFMKAINEFKSLESHDRFRQFRIQKNIGHWHNLEVLYVFKTLVNQTLQYPITHVIESGTASGRTTALLALLLKHHPGSPKLVSIGYPDQVAAKKLELHRLYENIVLETGSAETVIQKYRDNLESSVLLVDGPKPAVPDQAKPFADLFYTALECNVKHIYIQDCRRYKNVRNYAKVLQLFAQHPSFANYKMIEIPDNFMSDQYKLMPRSFDLIKAVRRKPTIDVEFLYAVGISNVLHFIWDEKINALNGI